MAVPPEPRNGGVLQATAGVANNIVGALTGTPTLLVMVLLNIAMIATAGWFLARQEDHRHVERKAAGELFERCIEIKKGATQ